MKNLTVFLIMFLAICCTPVFAGVDISSAFPDAAFRALITEYDTDGDGSLTSAEMEKITEVDCKKNTSIKDLTGIEHLTALKSLSCWQCPITKLDLSNNKQLEYLDCCETKITSLDVINNPNIRQLWAYGNAFTTLDLSNNPFLVKAANNGVYNNDKNGGMAYSFADEPTSSYLVIDKKVTVLLGGGKSITPSSDGKTTTDPTVKPKPANTLDVGETLEFSGDITLPGSLMDGFFPAVSSDPNVATASSARTGNIIYADGVRYFFSVWIKAVGPGTATITLYNDKKTVVLWERTVSVRGNGNTGNGNKGNGTTGNGNRNGNGSSSTANKVATIKQSATTAKPGKKVTIKASSGAAVTVTGKNALAKNKSFVKIGKSPAKAVKISFTKKAKKGAYKFIASCPANGNYKAQKKVITIKIK